MNESNSIKAIDKTNLSKQTKFRLNEIIGIENYFYQEINQRKSCSEKLNILSSFDYIDKILFHLRVLLEHQSELQVQALL